MDDFIVTPGRRHFTVTDATDYGWGLEHYARLTAARAGATPKQTLAYLVMASVPRDGDKNPRYYRGWQWLAEELSMRPRGLPDEDNTAERATEDLLAGLRKCGLIAYEGGVKPHRGTRANYVLLNGEGGPLRIAHVNHVGNDGESPRESRSNAHGNHVGQGRVQGHQQHEDVEESRGERDDELVAVDNSVGDDDEHGDVIEYVPEHVDRHSPPATTAQVQYLRDGYLLTGGRLPGPDFSMFSVASADAEMKQMRVALADPACRRPPERGTPEFEALSTNARRKIGQWERERLARA